MIRLWVHEVMRVFYDRLTDDADRDWLFKTVATLTREHFKDSFDSIFEHLANGGQGGKVSKVYADIIKIFFPVKPGNKDLWKQRPLVYEDHIWPGQSLNISC